MHPDYLFWKGYFLEANSRFLSAQRSLLETNINERTLCGSLSQILRGCLDATPYSTYHVDVEYNRNNGKVKTILGDQEQVYSINCDLIIHSRGENIDQDNLLALEMKKSTRPQREKQEDRDRVRILTKNSFDGVWSYVGRSFPEHVCRYIIGIYYEINLSERRIEMEFYSLGNLVESESAEF